MSNNLVASQNRALGMGRRYPSFPEVLDEIGVVPRDHISTLISYALW